MDKALLFARNNLLSYAIAQFSGYQPADHHRKIARALERVVSGDCKRLMIFMPPRHGKEVAHSTPVLTLGGWKTHGDLVVGDFVFSPDGSPVEVIALSEEHQDDYIVNVDGEEIRCHANHEWEIYSRPNKKYEVRETHDIANLALTCGFMGKRGGRYSYQVRNTEALEFDVKNLPIDPYFLGMWLGDGTRTDTSIVAHPSDIEPIEEIKRRGFVVTHECHHKDTSVIKYGFGQQGIIQTLRQLGCAPDKHVPRIYLESSIDQRLDLLAGLIDSDGHVERHTGRIRIATCDASLKDSLVELLYGLGMRPYVYEQQPCLSSSGIQGRKIVYYVGFQPDIDIPTKIPRKRLVVLKQQNKRPILSVEYKPNGEKGRCIQVNSPDGLYLVGKTLIPTHNSMLASEFFPAWYLGHHPDKYIIATTYAQELADDFGRKVRNQLQDPLFKAIFPECQISQDSASANKFNTIQKGSYFAVGMGGPITGRGAHVLLIDDPLKGREDAESETIRRKQKEWYQSVARTRLMPGGAIVVIQTRWMEDDLSGWLQSAHSHEGWEVITLPAISEDGTPLWPEMYDLKTLEGIRDAVGARDWNALYQQNPIPDSGDFFKREWFKFYDSPPANLYYYGASDFAVTEKGGDYTEHGIFGVDSENNIYIIDWWTGQTNSAEWIDSLLDLQDQWQTIRWFGESGVIRRSIEPQLVKRMEERKIYPNMEWLASTTDKSARSRGFQGRAANGKVFLPRKTQWAADLLSQIVRFPAGLHDDKVDVCSLMGRGLQYASAPSSSNIKRLDAYRDKKRKTTSGWAA